MSFVTECTHDSLPIWEKCLNSGFLHKLENGVLDETCFMGYIVDDSLYLREYAKVFAWGMTKAETMDDIRACYSLLSFVNEGEDATRRYYLNRYGLKDAEIQDLPQRPENRAYTECMIDAAQNGGMAECMMACLPCMISYGWIFQQLLARTPSVKDTPYWPLVRDYASEGYNAACQEWSDYTDRICSSLSSERQKHCMEIFRACSVHELHFWEMSEHPRNDLLPIK
ncbi:MAG: TENA/THI-4 family protein [Oscillospiraceae bacterium]|nr:TENA/THI-4 family protein [Oscillospiraceae bacterium]